MVDLYFWEQVASIWVNVRSKEDMEKATILVTNLVCQAKNNREEEKNIMEELLDFNGDEEGDDGY